MLTRRTFFRRAAGAVLSVLATAYVPSLAPAKPLVEPLPDGFAAFMRDVQHARFDYGNPLRFREPLCGPDGGYLIPPEIAESLVAWEKAGYPPLRMDPPWPGLTATWRVTT